MKKSTKVLLGIATIWPILYMFLFVAAALLMVFLAQQGGPPDRGSGSVLFPFGFFVFFILHMLTIFGHMGLTVFYIIRVFKTERLDQNLKIMWTLLLFFVGFFAQPIFWYQHIWRGMPETESEKPAQLGPGVQSSWRKQTAKEPEVAYVPPPQPPDWR
jgi:hypothetical protein